jgi:hypothetical protein
MKSTLFVFFVTSLISAGFSSSFANTSNSDTPVVEIWTRGNGNFTDGEIVKRQRLKRINLDKFTSNTTRVFDVQYDKKMSYKATKLIKLIKSASTKSSSDLVLLHFENGMIIPVPLEKNFKTFKKLNLMIATQIKIDGKWQRNFPQIEKINIRYKDPRPNKFSSTKLVAESDWYPLISRESFKQVKNNLNNDFSPWLHVNSLTGIEFANAKAYYKQFTPKIPLEQKVGLGVFLQRCQYCHGVRSVGASFGWDYLDPIPIYELRNANNIHLRVKHKFHDSFERGLLMPAQKDFSKAEANVFWSWLKKLGRMKNLRSYQTED